MQAYRSALAQVRLTLGSWAAVGRACGGLSGEAVRKWFVAGRPPRTEYTGETRYAEALHRAVDGAVALEALRPTPTPPRDGPRPGATAAPAERAAA